MTKRTVKLPSFAPKYQKASEADYDELLRSFKNHLTIMPEFVRELKRADNDGWQRMIDDLTKHIQTDRELSKFLRPAMKPEDPALSIGEPNWATVAMWVGGPLGAFAVGFMIGTACYELGPCDLVS